MFLSCVSWRFYHMDILFEPAVIISIVFSLLIAMLSKRLTRMGEYFISHMSLLSVKIRNKIRAINYKRRRKLILTVRSHHKVTWAIIKTHTLLIFFVLVSILYILLILLGPLRGIGNLPSSIQLLISSPIYLFEILWLFQRDKTQVLMKIADERVMKQINYRNPYQIH